MADGDPAPAARQGTDDKFRWYQTRLGFWQAIWGTLITGGLAVAIPAAVESYKTYVESYKISQETKKVEADTNFRIRDANRKYIADFVERALTPDIEARIRLSTYFSYVSGEKDQEGWTNLNKALLTRREELKREINLKTEQIDKFAARLFECPYNKCDDQSKLLTKEEEALYHRLQREVGWDYAEFGSVPKKLESR
jgi:hypothetical protein